jgi:hypothetical protein
LARAVGNQDKRVLGEQGPKWVLGGVDRDRGGARGTFDLAARSQADKMIEVLNAMKVFWKRKTPPTEAA